MNYPVINLFHVVFVGPLLVYLGYNKGNTSENIFNMVLYLGIIVILYHSYLSYKKLNKK
jgi:hypothetical protein